MQKFASQQKVADFLSILLFLMPWDKITCISLKSWSCMAVLKSSNMCVRLGHLLASSCRTVCVISSMGSSMYRRDGPKRTLENIGTREYVMGKTCWIFIPRIKISGQMCTRFLSGKGFNSIKWSKLQIRGIPGCKSWDKLNDLLENWVKRCYEFNFI